MAKLFLLHIALVLSLFTGYTCSEVYDENSIVFTAKLAVNDGDSINEKEVAVEYIDKYGGTLIDISNQIHKKCVAAFGEDIWVIYSFHDDILGISKENRFIEEKATVEKIKDGLPDDWFHEVSPEKSQLQLYYATFQNDLYIYSMFIPQTSITFDLEYYPEGRKTPIDINNAYKISDYWFIQYKFDW